MNQPLTVGVVGLRGMGMSHARAFAASPEFRVTAGCDLDPARLAEFGATFPAAAAERDYGRMLAGRPEVVVVATPTSAHAALTLAAVEAGVRGVLCEKPMAVNLGDARRMAAACREHRCALIVNHQRRTERVYRTMRRLIREGAIGTVELIQGSCAGDVLSDGTHTVDSIRWLAGDEPVAWVSGQVWRDTPDPAAPRGMGYDASGGWRYGHPIESGATAMWRFASGVFGVLHTGNRRMNGRHYQDLEVFGSEGGLWRAGDQAGETLLIERGGAGNWQPVEPLDPPDPALIHREFARMIREGGSHPLSGDSALADQEVVMAVYESARLGSRILLPLAQERYPLELLIEGASGR